MLESEAPMTRNRGVCQAEVAFKTRLDALIHASVALRHNPAETDTYRAYECPLCKKFHLTKRHP